MCYRRHQYIVGTASAPMTEWTWCQGPWKSSNLCPWGGQLPASDLPVLLVPSRILGLTLASRLAGGLNKARSPFSSLALSTPQTASDIVHGPS